MGDELFDDGDPFNHPAWQHVAEMIAAPPRPTNDYGIYSLTWLARVLPVVHTPDQLAVAMLLYR